MAVKKVHIRVFHGVLCVPQPVVRLSKGKKDTIEWKCTPANQPFLVCFGERSPFKYTHFHNGRPKSGPIGRGIPPGSVYKYSVEFQGKVLDPGVIIDL
jgi:hypothetical protein